MLRKDGGGVAQRRQHGPEPCVGSRGFRHRPQGTGLVVHESDAEREHRRDQGTPEHPRRQRALPPHEADGEPQHDGERHPRVLHLAERGQEERDAERRHQPAGTPITMEEEERGPDRQPGEEHCGIVEVERVEIEGVHRVRDHDGKDHRGADSKPDRAAEEENGQPRAGKGEDGAFEEAQDPQIETVRRQPADPCDHVADGDRRNEENELRAQVSAAAVPFAMRAVSRIRRRDVRGEWIHARLVDPDSDRPR